MTAIALAATWTLTAACGRSGGGPSTPNQSASAATQSTSSSANAGTFGSLKNICGPGSASGATARGVTNSEIQLATFSDTGNTYEPGLEQEFSTRATLS